MYTYAFKLVFLVSDLLVRNYYVYLHKLFYSAYLHIHSVPQAHLLSVFDNVKTVTFHEKDYDRITHINSKEPETVEVSLVLLFSMYWLPNHFSTTTVAGEASHGSG